MELIKMVIAKRCIFFFALSEKKLAGFIELLMSFKSRIISR